MHQGLLKRYAFEGAVSEAPVSRSGNETMTKQAEDLLQKLRTLPPQRLAQVSDFVDFLRVREEKARIEQVDELFGMMDRLIAVEPQLTPEEIQDEIAAARAERRAG